MKPRPPRPTAGPSSKPPNEDWPPAVRKPLRGQVALVAGATRGAGRAIAVSLGLAGATVYATGRSTRGHPATPGRPETIEETAQIIRTYGGRAYAVRVDHTVESEVRRLVRRIARREHGRLDLLVNDVWGGEELTEWGKPPWTMSYQRGRTMLERAVLSHILTSRYAVPLMVARRRGIVFEITDGDHLDYRGSFFYDLVKATVIRLALAYHEEFEEAKLPRLSAIAVTPGFLRSEYMLDQFGVTEENWRDAAGKVRRFEFSETPYFLGRAIVALAADPRAHAKSGKVYGSWTLAKEYRFTDRNGTRPDWGKAFREGGP
jgi:NAD(P)-dependent dehydrogenase (short-subunit alcohol dehydrogenase family)